MHIKINHIYNINGRRIRKYTNDYSIDIHYYYDINNKLILKDRGTYKLRYLYNTNNEIYEFIKEDITDKLFFNKIPNLHRVGNCL